MISNQMNESAGKIYPEAKFTSGDEPAKLSTSYVFSKYSGVTCIGWTFSFQKEEMRKKNESDESSTIRKPSKTNSMRS